MLNNLTATAESGHTRHTLKDGASYPAWRREITGFILELHPDLVPFLSDTSLLSNAAERNEVLGERQAFNERVNLAIPAIGADNLAHVRAATEIRSQARAARAQGIRIILESISHQAISILRLNPDWENAIKNAEIDSLLDLAKATFPTGSDFARANQLRTEFQELTAAPGEDALFFAKRLRDLADLHNATAGKDSQISEPALVAKYISSLTDEAFRFIRDNYTANPQSYRTLANAAVEASRFKPKMMPDIVNKVTEAPIRSATTSTSPTSKPSDKGKKGKRPFKKAKTTSSATKSPEVAPKLIKIRRTIWKTLNDEERALLTAANKLIRSATKHDVVNIAIAGEEDDAEITP